MKHIKLFESFLLEGTGLVTGKHDIDQLIDFLIKIPVNWDGNRVVAVIKPKGASDKDNIYVSLNKGSETEAASANHVKRNITIESNQDVQFMRMMVAHELSHILDIGMRVIDAKYPNRRKDFYKNSYKLTPEAFFKEYINDETEREAWPSGFVYVINSLLMKHPEKIEHVKDLIIKKDWHMEKVFPELQNIVNDYLSYTFSTYGKIRERFFKRLSASIITHKKGEIIDFKAVIIDDSEDKRIKRVEPIEKEPSMWDNYSSSRQLEIEYERDIWFYKKGIKNIESNRLVKKAADEMNIETVTIKSKIAEDVSPAF